VRGKSFWWEGFREAIGAVKMGKKSSLNLFEHYDSRGKSSSSGGKKSFNKGGLRRCSESEKNVVRQESRQRRQEDKSLVKAQLQRSVRQQERTRKYSDLGEEDEQLVGHLLAQVAPADTPSLSILNAAAIKSMSVAAAKRKQPQQQQQQQQQQRATKGQSSSSSSSSAATAASSSSSPSSSALISDLKQELYVALFGPKRHRNCFAFDSDDEEDEAEGAGSGESGTCSSSSISKKAYPDSMDEQVFNSLLPSMPLAKPLTDEEATFEVSLSSQQHRPRSFLAVASGKRDYYIDGLSLHPIELVHANVDQKTLRALVFGLHGEDDRLPSARLSLLVAIFRLASIDNTTAFPAPTLAAHGTSCELKRSISTLLAEATNSLADAFHLESSTKMIDPSVMRATSEGSSKGTRGKRMGACASSAYNSLFELLHSIAMLVASSSSTSSSSFSSVVCMLIRAAAGGVRLLAAAASSTGAIRASIEEQSRIVFAALKTLLQVADEEQKRDFLSRLQRNWPSKCILEQEVFIKTLDAVSCLLLLSAPFSHSNLDQCKLSSTLPLMLSSPNSTRQKLVSRLVTIACSQASLCASAAIDLFSANLELAKQASPMLIFALQRNVSLPHWQPEIKSKSASLLQSIESA